MRSWLLLLGGTNPGHERKKDHLPLVLLNKTSVRYLDSYYFDDIHRYNGLVVFTSLESATVLQLERIVAFSTQKNKQILFIHEASIYNRDCIAFKDMLGVRFKSHYPYGTFEVQKTVDHWSTTGCNNHFLIQDELYFLDRYPSLKNYKTLLHEAITLNPLLLVREDVDNNTKIFYLSIGHDEKTLSSDYFIKILNNIVLPPICN